MTLPAASFADFRVRRGEAMDQAFFDRRFRLIVELLASFRSEIERQGASTDQLVQIGLARINEILTPTLLHVQQAAELGFLVAVSNTETELIVGQQPTFELTLGTRRRRSSPSRGLRQGRRTRSRLPGCLPTTRRMVACQSRSSPSPMSLASMRTGSSPPPQVSRLP